jgi:RNA polymerase sigma-70 factor (ECF subfamily)
MGTNIEIQSKAERFESVALRYMDSIYKSALYRTRNEEDARDLVQDTYLRAYRFFDKFDEGTDCRAWLYSIMTNIFINSFRRKKKRPTGIRISEMQKQGEDLPGEDNPEDEVFGDLFGDDVTNALESIHEQYRAVVFLADVEEFTYKEIADTVGCPIGTVMSRLHRARELLRRRLREYAEYYGYA